MAEVSPDYSDLAYYNICVDVWLGAEGVGGTGSYCATGIGMGCVSARAEVVLPHDPNAEYDL